MTKTTDYTVRLYKQPDQEAVLRLLQRSLGGGPTGQRSAEFFEWKHERNPFGRSIATVAELDGEIIGFRTFMRWTFRAHGEDIPAVRAVDTATDPAHQGKGIFRRLTMETLDLVREHAAFVFNTPNTQSLPGYLKFGWREVGSVPLHVRVRRPVRFIRNARLAATVRGETSAMPSALPHAHAVLGDDKVIASLLAQQPLHDRLATAHSPETLRWRYATAPGLDYRVIPAERGGRLVGLGIGRLRQRGPLVEFSLVELLGNVAAVLPRAAKAGGDYVITHLDGRLSGTGARHGYLRAPGQTMMLTANELRPISLSPLALDNWRLALGDLEVF